MASRALGEDLSVGRELGHYRIVEKIGAGGMGEVYRARDEHLARDVAIKVLPPGTLTDESARKHFHKEALILSQLNHPNVATIYDFDTQQGVDFLVMEFIPGATLSEKVAVGALPEKEVLRLGVQLAEGLAAAHDHGVVHRDLKPGNLRLTGDGRLKILDFGLAKLWHPVTASAATESLSEAQGVAGTLPYMAPEQLLGGEIDARTDLHAAGLVLYEMATGRYTFADVENSQLIGAILHRAPRPPTALNSRLSPELERIIQKCLEKDAGLRYQSAREIAVDLKRIAAPSLPAPVATAKKHRPIWVISSLSVAIVIAAGIWLFMRAHRAHVLTERDTIVLTDFDNKTGDSVFDDTLKQALAIQLEQSPFLNVLSDRKVADTLRLMNRKPSERITPAVGQEMCIRTGSKAMLSGSIASLGSHYAVMLRASDCRTGESLASVEAEADSREHVLRALSDAATNLRGKLGESLRSIQKLDKALDEATTSSLEALQAWNQGQRLFVQGSIFDSLPHYQRAVELDPNFARAYMSMATVYGHTGEFGRQAECLEKAYSLRERVSERERYLITAAYQSGIAEDRDKAVEVYTQWIQSYPREISARTSLGSLYTGQQQYDKAISELREALRIDPTYGPAYQGLMEAYFAMNRLDDAKATLNEALARKLDGFSFRYVGYIVAFAQGDAAAMREHANWGIGKPGAEEGWMLWVQGAGDYYYGRFASARKFGERSFESSLRHGGKEPAAYQRLCDAAAEAWAGNAEFAGKNIAAALQLTREPWHLAMAAAILSEIRLTAQADKLRNEAIRNLRPSRLDTLTQSNLAMIELGHNQPARAIERLRNLPPPPSDFNFWVSSARGRALLAQGQASEAVAEFQKIIDRRTMTLITAFTGTVGTELGPFWPITYVWLARANVEAGDTAAARRAYEQFFAIWKDADSGIPILKEAKAEYAKLQ
jgi:eukaryotic-like serine/threonine-protein kinase